MTAKLPRCAFCGKPLAGSSRRVVETLPDLPGGPSFGWHMQNDGVLGCYEKDKSLERMNSTYVLSPIRSPEGHMRMVNTIAARGLNRVVFTRKIARARRMHASESNAATTAPQAQG